MPLTACTTVSKPRRGCPWTLMTERTNGQIDEPRPELVQGLGREAARIKRARPIALQKNIGALNQSAQRFPIIGRAQVQMGSELAMAGVGVLVPHLRKVRSRDFENLGAVFGKG